MSDPLPSVVAVTGGANGIGLGIAEEFARAGYDVAIIDIDGTLAENAAKDITRKHEVRTIGLAADVADRESCHQAHMEICEAIGPVLCLVNNAGIMPQRKGWIEELPPNDFDRMIAVHVSGAVNWCRLVLPGMRLAKFGRIINVSSVNAILAVPHRLAYVTAKKAILGLTEGLALDCARSGITVNAIAPGYVLTETLKARADAGLLDRESVAERTPVGRWGRIEDIARVVLFLADKKSGFITGTTIPIDGGLTIRGDPDENLDISPLTATDTFD